MNICAKSGRMYTLSYIHSSFHHDYCAQHFVCVFDYFVCIFLFPSPTMVRIRKAKTTFIHSDGLNYAGISIPKSQRLYQCHLSLGLQSHRGAGQLCTAKSLLAASRQTTFPSQITREHAERKRGGIGSSLSTPPMIFFHTTKVTNHTFRIYELLSKKKNKVHMQTRSLNKSTMNVP